MDVAERRLATHHTHYMLASQKAHLPLGPRTEHAPHPTTNTTTNTAPAPVVDCRTAPCTIRQCRYVNKDVTGRATGRCLSGQGNKNTDTGEASAPPRSRARIATGLIAGMPRCVLECLQLVLAKNPGTEMGLPCLPVLYIGNA